MHVESDELVYDAVTCAACGAKIREDRPVCFRCGQRLVAVLDEPAGVPLATFASVVLCLALVGVGATRGKDAPAEGARTSGETRANASSPVDSVEAGVAPDPIMGAAHPQDAEALNNLARALDAAGRTAEAAAAYRRYLDLNPDETSAEKIKARIARLEGTASPGP